MSKIILVTTDTVPGKKITEVIGLAHSSSVQTKNALSDIGAGFKSLIGGKLDNYTQMIEAAKLDALTTIKEMTKSAGGNAVVGLRFATTSTTQHGSAEIIAYGTAVKVA